MGPVAGLAAPPGRTGLQPPSAYSHDPAIVKTDTTAVNKLAYGITVNPASSRFIDCLWHEPRATGHNAGNPEPGHAAARRYRAFKSGLRPSLPPSPSKKCSKTCTEHQ